jgi:hypothetical protein
MDRDDQRNPVVFLRQDSAEVRIPGVAMDEVGIDPRGVEVEATLHRAEDRLQRFWAGVRARVDLETFHPKVLTP